MLIKKKKDKKKERNVWVRSSRLKRSIVEKLFFLEQYIPALCYNRPLSNFVNKGDINGMRARWCRMAGLRMHTQADKDHKNYFN